ncbi:MAG: MBG domain-containing protein, partial [Acidimicrobiales bacterium]|nr:MBG domain-containing protein [Acidimicrobiales bacterium]
IVAWSSGGGWQNAATAALSSAVLNPIPVQVSGTQTYGDSSPSWAYAPRAALPSGVQIEGTLTCTRTRTAPISPALPKGTYTAEPSACSGLRLAGTNAAANVLVYVAGSFEVTPAPLMVTASSAAMTYGGTPPIVTPSYAGFVNGEDASDLLRRPACESGADSRSSVGTYPSTCHGAAAQNYSIQHTAGQITVLPAPLTVTASSPGTTYGDALPIVTPRFFGFVNSDDTSDLAQQPICTTAADERSPAGNYRTECAGARSLNYAVIAIEGTHSIAKAPLTITASGPVMTYGDPAPAVTALYAGFVKGEDAGALSAQPTCSTSAGPRTHVGDSPRTTCRDASADSYALTYVDGFVTVVPRPLLVTASSGSAPYGTPPTVTALYSGFANGETSLVLDTLPTCSTAATASTGVGPYPTRCTGGADSDYRLTYAEGSWTVTRAPLTITAPDASSVYGQDPPTLVPSYSGFVNREGPGVLTSPARCRTEATSGSDAGTYPTVCAQAAADNYELRYVDGVLTVAQAPLSVVAGNQSRPYDEADPLFTWQLVGFVNDDTAAEVGGEPVLHTDATLSSPVGTYPIVVETGSLVAHNYRFVPTNGTLTIVKAVTQVLNTQADMARSAGAPYGWVAATVRYGTADKPVVGLPVTFTSSGRVLCSATTDAAGYARCSLTDRTHRSMIARDGFVASFAGGQNFLASSATGSVN